MEDRATGRLAAPEAPERPQPTPAEPKRPHRQPEAVTLWGRCGYVPTSRVGLDLEPDQDEAASEPKSGS